MAIEILSHPAGPVLSGNPIRFTVQSTDFVTTSPVKHIYRVILNSSDMPEAGDSINIESAVMGIDASFVCAATPSGPYQFSAAGSMDVEEYIDSVLIPTFSGVSAIHLNYILYRAGSQLIFEAREYGPSYDFSTWTTSGFSITTTTTSGVLGVFNELQIRAKVVLATTSVNTYPIESEWMLFSPDESGQIEWDAREVLSEMWEQLDTPPEGLTTVYRNIRSVRPFFVVFAEHQGEQPFATLEYASPPIIGQRGGFASYDWETDYATAFVDAGAWLTHRSGRIKHQPQTIDYLHFWTSNAFLGVDATLKAKVYFDDLTNTTTDVWTNSSLVLAAVYTIPLGFESLGLQLLEPTKSAHKFELWIEDGLGNTLIPKFTVVLETTHFRNFSIQYHNSFGLLETIPCEGARIMTAKATRETAVSARNGDSAVDSSEKSFDVSTRPTIEVNTGPLTPGQAISMQEVLLSAGHTLVSSEADGQRKLAGRIIPSTVQSFKMTGKNRDCHQFTFQFELEKQTAFSQINWSPQ